MALIIITILTYAHTFSYEFLYDDEFLIQKNLFLRSWENLWPLISNSSTAGFGGADSFYRPLQGFLYLLIYQIFGETPAAFRGLNILLHAINTALIYQLLLSLFGRERLGLCFGLAILWMIHPMHVEAVTYISGTADPLSGLFVLLAALVFLNWQGQRRIYTLLAITFFGLAAKETSVVIPAALTALSFWQQPTEVTQRPLLQRLTAQTLISLQQLWPVWLLVFAYLVSRATVLNFDSTFSFYSGDHVLSQNFAARFYTFLTTLPTYLQLWVAPVNLHIDRDFPITETLWTLEVGLGACLLGAILLPIFLKCAPIFLFASLWFVASHFPHTGLLIPVNALILDHWMYLPSLSLIVLMGVVARQFSRPLHMAAGIIIFFVWGYLQVINQQHWQNAETLYRHILAQGSRSLRVMNNLAMTLSDQGKVQEALQWYQTILAGGGDSYPQVHHNTARAYLATGQVDLAVKHANLALIREPRFFQSAFLLAEIYQASGQAALAQEWAEKGQAIYKQTRQNQGIRQEQ